MAITWGTPDRTLNGPASEIILSMPASPASTCRQPSFTDLVRVPYLTAIESPPSTSIDFKSYVPPLGRRQSHFVREGVQYGVAQRLVRRAKSTSEYRAHMKRKEMKLGVKLRVVNDRWDSLRGTLALVESIGYVGNPRTWYFRVRWIRAQATRWGNISSNLFSEDLVDFELHRRPKSR